MLMKILLPGGRGQLLGEGDFTNLEECHRDDAQVEGEAKHGGVIDLKNKTKLLLVESE